MENKNKIINNNINNKIIYIEDASSFLKRGGKIEIIKPRKIKNKNFIRSAKKYKNYKNYFQGGVIKNLIS